MMKAFLSAEWKDLAMFNYVVDPAILTPLLPIGTELDFFNGQTYLSIVAFLFQKTRVLACPVPFHGSFEEVNLRFYIRRREGREWRRAVAFIQELVPLPAVAYVANTLFHEHYAVARMSHEIRNTGDGREVSFTFQKDGISHALSVVASQQAADLTPGSQEEFIAQHFWGYAAQPNGDVVEYAVNHPAWRIHEVKRYRLQINFQALYGFSFAAHLTQAPHSVFLAEGSPVTVSFGRRIRAAQSGPSDPPPSTHHPAPR